MGLVVAAAGTHPLTIGGETQVSGAGRYRALGASQRMLDRAAVWSMEGLLLPRLTCPLEFDQSTSAGHASAGAGPLGRVLVHRIMRRLECCYTRRCYR